MPWHLSLKNGATLLSTYLSKERIAIAARASTSIGGLYRFFPNKLAIFHALAGRYLNQIRKLFAAFQESATQLSLDSYISQMLDSFDEFVTANPGYRVVFVQSRFVSSDVLAMDADLNRQVAQQLATFFAFRKPDLDSAQGELIAAVCVEVASALEILSLTREQSFQQRILAETKSLLIGYLQQYFPD